MILLAAAFFATVAPDDFTLTIPVRPETDEGQYLLASHARKVCGTRYPQLIRFSFSGSEGPGPAGEPEASYEVRQELACLDGPPAAQPPRSRVADDWQPADADVARIKGLTSRYFDLVDSGDAAAIHAMLSDKGRASRTVEEHAGQVAEFRKTAGEPGRHRLAKLTWYVNPANAAPGIYAAADFEREYSRLHVNCGYLIWHSEGDGNFVLMREESSVVPDDVQVQPGSAAEMRKVARCVD